MQQAEAYGKFAEEPTRPELERFFFLDDVDRDLIALRRTKHHQLGFALQMCTVRYIGLFLEDPLAVPWSVVEHLAAQLGIEDPSCVKRYAERRQTLYDHAWEIRDAYGYHPYVDPEWGRRFRTFLHGRAWTHAEGPVALFNQAVGWLRRNRVLLPALARRRVKDKPLLPREVDDKLVPAAWRKAVYANPSLPQGAVDRDAYVVCVLEQLHRALQRRDVFASPSHRWSDPRARLLDGKEWDAVCEDVLAGLSLDMPVEEHLAALVSALDAAWKLMAERLEEAGKDAKVSIEVQPNGRAKLNVDALGALGESKSLRWLRKTVEKMLPKIDLPDLLFEVHSWTEFLDAFVHLGDGTTRMKDLHTSLVALLVSEACNIGLTPVTNPGVEALTRSRLVHVDQYYLRADTIAAANAALIAAQAEVPIVRYWGDGLLASVDGLRFVVPVRTINAAPSPKYFGFKRGITWLNAVDDQVAGIGQMVAPGTPRDSLHISDALLNLDGGVKPEMVATDNASDSDMVFGLFKILGYNFSPRFRDLDDQRFWRATMPGVETGTYGPLEDIARNRVNLNKVITHWPDMLRVAGSLVTNQVRAYDLLRMFGREGHPTPLGQAFAEYGRIAKTLHLLAVVDPVDDTYRRQMNRQLTVQESRHKLARDVCHGKRGTIHQAYRDGMEDQLGSLGLVLNAVVLWTTRYIDAAVAQLRAEGHEIRDEDIARLSPLKHKNLNVLGRYSFTASVPAGGLRPLRDPDAPGLDDDEDDGAED
ncbi:Tn3 family transposase [Streptomyces sp. NPDC057271]|uniref:Tn3 family transposase n=1 Tax=unclassified Streptomyces TaxID=2593676 RepID=UPI00362673AA